MSQWQRGSSSTASHVALTGASGFLGRGIRRQLRARTVALTLVDRRVEVPRDPAIPVEGAFEADITKPESLAGVFAGSEAVVHAAGLAHVFDRSGAMDSALWRVNADGTENVATAAAQAGVLHLVLVSTAAVYGPHEGSTDETTPCRPVGAYAQSKLEAERRATGIALEHGMALTILRPVTMYGEGDPGNVLRLIRSVDRRRFLWIGNGTNRKSLLHRDDVAEACVLALGRKPEGVEVLNVAGPSYEMCEVISTISKELGRGVPPVHIPSGPVMAMARMMGRITPNVGGGRNGLLDSLRKWVQDDVYDGRKIQQLLGWQPRVHLQSGLQREIKWYLESRGSQAK